MKIEDVDEFEAVEPQLVAMREELLVLVKKSPHDALSSFKMNVVNGLIRRANAFLDERERPMADFTEFSSEALPSSSDAVIVIAQYLVALENFRAKRIEEDSSGEWYWNTDLGKRSRQTYRPRKLRG
jgi:hypothetical protein